MYEATMMKTPFPSHLTPTPLFRQHSFSSPPPFTADHLSCHAHASPWRANVSSCEEQTPPTLKGSSIKESEGNLGDPYEELFFFKPELGVLSRSTAVTEQRVASRPTTPHAITY
jgi:hypothetical protein